MTGFRTTIAAFGLAALMALGIAPAAGQTVSDSMSADEIEALLSGAGLSPNLIRDRDTGAPVAMARLGGVTFMVRAMDCEGRPARCSQLLFFANFALERAATDEDYRTVNDFNDSSLEGRAYVLEATDEIGVDFTIDLTGGVTPAHVDSRLSRWQGIVEGFLTEMRAAQTGS